jgi:hypothetical protein
MQIFYIDYQSILHGVLLNGRAPTHYVQYKVPSERFKAS